MGVNSDELLRRWVPVGPVSEGTVPSYHAKGPDGQFVQVHRIPRDAPDFGRLFSLVQRVLPQPPPDLVEVGEFEGGVAVVTRILPGPVTLEDWLQDSAARLEPASPQLGAESEEEVPPAPDLVPDPAPGDLEAAGPEDEDSYTSYFRIPQEGEVADQPPPPPEERQVASPPPPAPEPRPAPPPAAPSGDEGYTALFAAPQRPAEPEAPRPPRDAPPPPPPTRPPEPPPPPPPTRPPEPPPPPPPPRAAPPPPPPRQDFSAQSAPETGSITDMFRKPEAPPPAPPERRRQQRWDEPERGLSPLQLTLDEYIRRLERS
ncbi:MAG: hypothetical protein PVJ76_03650 [Gemmatimonadota bacterium]|jgi:hypothetical protein